MVVQHIVRAYWRQSPFLSGKDAPVETHTEFRDGEGEQNEGKDYILGGQLFPFKGGKT